MSEDLFYLADWISFGGWAFDRHPSPRTLVPSVLFAAVGMADPDHRYSPRYLAAAQRRLDRAVP
jgi:hypothetical protein